MKLMTAIERIYQLITFIEISPTNEQLVKFLSIHIDPLGEIAGVSWITLLDSGFLNYDLNAGFHKDLDTSIPIEISSDNLACVALRTGKAQYVDLRTASSEFKDHTHEEYLESYSCVLAIPLSHQIALGIVFNAQKSKIIEYHEYFDCIRLILSLWISRQKFDMNPISTKVSAINSPLTSRQESILVMIKEGKTNLSIAGSLGYSESLIRQESIIIYRKLGVKGRKDLINPAG